MKKKLTKKHIIEGQVYEAGTEIEVIEEGVRAEHSFDYMTLVGEYAKKAFPNLVKGIERTIKIDDSDMYMEYTSALKKSMTDSIARYFNSEDHIMF